MVSSFPLKAFGNYILILYHSIFSSKIQDFGENCFESCPRAPFIANILNGISAPAKEKTADFWHWSTSHQPLFAVISAFCPKNRVIKENWLTSLGRLMSQSLWYAGQDSNLRPLAPEANALSSWATGACADLVSRWDYSRKDWECKEGNENKWLFSFRIVICHFPC